MATKKWFVLVGSEEMGPLGPGGLRKLVRKGQIRADTLVRREDHAEPVPAARIRGLLPAEAVAAAAVADLPVLGADVAASPHAHRRHGPRAVIHGPYTSLLPLGWSTAVVMFLFAVLGGYGTWVGVGQLRHAAAADGAGFDPEQADALLFGLGVWAVLGLVVAGGLFLWWLFTARVNLPHLIHAHIRLAPSWAVVSWFVPFLNLAQPYSIVAETDRLSAEALADGDLAVQADHRLLAPWWTAALLGTAFALSYMLIGKGDADALRRAAWLHVLAGACTFLAGVFAGWLVLRITRNQERAHERHDEPVEPHHARKPRRHRVPILQGAE